MSRARNGQVAALRAIESSQVVTFVAKHDPDGANVLSVLAGDLLSMPDTKTPSVRADLQSRIASPAGPLHAATVFLVARALGKAPDEQLLAAAAGLELLVCFPAFLLEVKDDAHSTEDRHANAHAILMADCAVAGSLRPLSRLSAPMVSLAADLACSLSEGVALEFELRGESKRDVDRMVALAERLQGASLSLAARIAAELAGASPPVVAALADYGRELGVAFGLSLADQAPVDERTRHARAARCALERASSIQPATLAALAELAGGRIDPQPRLAPAA